jgi:hypothetical protein
MTAAVPTSQLPSVLPDWAARLLAEGGEQSPWLTVTQALPYLPMPRNKAYRACERYLARLEREKKRRHSPLVPADSLIARDGELPCRREGRSIVLSKRYLLLSLLGYLPEIPGAQP